MEYSVKRKLVNGNIVYGIIDESLKEVLPFEYSNIEERTYDNHSSYNHDTKQEKYYIVSNQDSKKGIFLGGSIVLEPTYDDVDFIPDGAGWPKFIVGCQNEQGMQYGIL